MRKRAERQWTARAMYCLRGNRLVAFFDHTPAGLEDAKSLRRADDHFKRRHITTVLQCSEVRSGKIYEIGEVTP